MVVSRGLVLCGWQHRVERHYPETMENGFRLFVEQLRVDVYVGGSGTCLSSGCTVNVAGAYTHVGIAGQHSSPCFCKVSCQFVVNEREAHLFRGIRITSLCLI